jgi:hypothetical protein
MTDYERILLEAKREFPGFQVVPKGTSRFMQILFKVMLMKFWCPEFMIDFTTTIGKTIYMPQDIIGSDLGADVIEHECQHIRDSSGLMLLPFCFSYLFMLPIGPSFRALWEFRGYRVSMAVWYRRHGGIPNWLLSGYCREFTGSNYLWMWPFPKHIRACFERAREEIIAGP